MCQAMNVGGGHLVMNSSAWTTSTFTLFSRSLDTSFVKYFGVRIVGSVASGTPNYKVEWEASNSPPSAEAASDATFVVPDGMAAISNQINDANWHVIGFNPPPAGNGRLKITGLAGNVNAGSITAQIWMQG